MKDKEYMKRLIKYCEKIVMYMKEVKSYEDFSSNLEKVDAVILNLEQIGETAKKLSDGGKKVYPDINWLSIIGLRNMISHEYEGIKLEIIYDIAINKISYLLNKLN
ncbi:MAG: DUF86 domain-containing protein [Tenericutes bacterium]|nr:DUF86 domain-containing protein [Mycoplasmatota bacterium]